MASKAQTKEKGNGRRKSGKQSESSGAIALLESDHSRFKQLLKQLEDESEDGSPEECRELLEELEAGLKAHTQIEEEIFYPEFKEAAGEEDQHIYFEAVEEHRVVDMVLPDMMDENLESEEFAAKAKVLKELVQHHIEEEEGTMFPKARKAFSKEDLEKLGERMTERKAELLSEMGRSDESAGDESTEEENEEAPRGRRGREVA
jgi:hemerythrin-like domain-containing protein